MVRYGPEKPRSYNEHWPNNLGLAGSGQVAVTAESVAFSDRNPKGDPQRRRLAIADIANVGYAEAENIVAVRTRNDDREVLVWMASAEDMRAFLALLPKITTPEFVEKQRQHQKFHENMKAISPKAPVTPVIIGMNVVLFLVMLLAGAGLMGGDGRVYLYFGANFGPLTWNGQEWRLLTHAFIHFGLIHLAFNMFALYGGGLLIERLFGSWRFAVIYLLSALAGGVVSGWWDPMRLSAGASGAVFGVYGALLAFFARRPGAVPADLLKSVSGGATSLVVYSLAFGLALPLLQSFMPTGVALPRVDNSAHVGGLLAGAISGYLLARPFEPDARRVARPWQVTGVVIGVCAALAWLAAYVRI